MITDARLMGFVPTREFGAAKVFYRDKLGLELVDEDGFALVFTVGARQIRVVKVGAFTPYPFTLLGFEVADIAAEVRMLSERGVNFTRYPHFEQDELGIWTAPGGARVAWFRDPDGNTLSLTALIA